LRKKKEKNPLLYEISGLVDEMGYAQGEMEKALFPKN